MGGCEATCAGGWRSRSATYAELRQAGVPEAEVAEVKRHGTAILRLQAAPGAARTRKAPPGTELGLDVRGVPVLRSHASAEGGRPGLGVDG